MIESHPTRVISPYGSLNSKKTNPHACAFFSSKSTERSELPFATIQIEALYFNPITQICGWVRLRVPHPQPSLMSFANDGCATLWNKFPGNGVEMPKSGVENVPDGLVLLCICLLIRRLEACCVSISRAQVIISNN